MTTKRAPIEFLPSQTLRFETQSHERIHQRLQLLGPGPAAFFRDACRIAYSPAALDTSSHLLGHCLREIESAVRALLSSAALAQGKGKGKGEDTHRQMVEGILEAYAIAKDSHVGRTWLAIADKSSAMSLPRHAHRDDLAVRAFDERSRELWLNATVLLDEILDGFEARFANHVHAAEILAAVRQPTAQDLDSLKQKTPQNAVVLSRFFAIAGPEWLDLLANDGYFSSPPERELSADEAYVRFPQWPASKYLVRLASTCSTENSVTCPLSQALGRVLRAIPATENIWVHEAIVTCTTTLSAEDAAAIAKTAKKWLTHGCAVSFPEKFAKLALHLLECDSLVEGLDAAAALLVLDPSEEPPERRNAAFDEYSFKIVLDAIVPRLSELAGIRALALFCSALQAAVGTGSVPGATPDEACRFRSAIEEHAQDRHYRERPASLLLDAVRDCAELLVQSDATRLADVITHLGGYTPAVFLRVALHLVRVQLPRSRDLVARFLLDPELLDSTDVWRERRLLERDGLEHLEPLERDAFFAQLRQAMSREPPSARDAWVRSHMALISQHLPNDLERLLATSAAARPLSKHPEFLRYLGLDETITPDRAIAALDAMSTDEVVPFLKRWTPDPEASFDPHARAQVSRKLTALVARSPEPYAAIAETFRELHPSFIRGLLEGLSDAFKGGAAFDWRYPLFLCLWVAQQTAEELTDAEKPRSALDDPNWNWTQQQICALLVSALGAKQNTIPLLHRDLLTQIAAALLTHEGAGSANQGDAFSRANNTLRGKSVELLICLICWEYSHTRASDHAPMLSEMPALRDLLVECLESSVGDPEVTRATIAWHLGWLVTIDRQWVETNLTKLFPAGPIGDSAMRVYLQWNPANGVMFEVLHSLFQRTIEQLPGRAEGDDETRAIVQHLVPLYWWGRIDLNAGLLRDFLTHSSVQQRAALLKYVGFTLRHADGDVPSVFIERSQRLWEARLEAVRNKVTTAEELAPFGWWFASGKFPLAWAVSNLREVLTYRPKLELEQSVAEELGALATADPIEALHCLTALADAVADDSWRALGLRDGVAAAVRAAKSASDPRAAQLADELVSRLAARGNPEYLNLT